jgi:hypothetical protein
MRRIAVFLFNAAWLVGYLTLLIMLLPLGALIALWSQPFDTAEKDRWQL